MFAFLLFIVLSGIYIFIEHNRSNSFFNKLDERAMIAAQFNFAEDNLSKKIFQQVAKKFPQSLSRESINIYTDKLQPISKDSITWNKGFIKRILEHKIAHFTKGERQASGLYYEDNSGNFVVIVSAIDERGFYDMEQLGIIMSVFFVASLFITFFIGRIFANLSLQPIVMITDNLKRTRSSNLHLRLPVNAAKTDEIDTLSLTINQLLEHLEQSFDSQKSFVANASHELRTPITSILGEAEITLMKDRKPAQYKAALLGIVSSVERLNLIINSLMELMQTNLNNKDFQQVKIDELMWEIADELSDNNRGNVTFKYNLPEDSSKRMLFGNRRLLFISINNILKNAIKFSEGKPILCAVSYKDGGIRILIQDKGIGIGKDDLKKIFQPFYRASNAMNFQGYGIGLSLTDNIVRLHNGKIDIKSEIGKGTSITLFFPTV